MLQYLAAGCCKRSVNAAYGACNYDHYGNVSEKFVHYIYLILTKLRSVLVASVGVAGGG